MPQEFLGNWRPYSSDTYDHLVIDADSVRVEDKIKGHYTWLRAWQYKIIAIEGNKVLLVTKEQVSEAWKKLINPGGRFGPWYPYVLLIREQDPDRPSYYFLIFQEFDSDGIEDEKTSQKNFTDPSSINQEHLQIIRRDRLYSDTTYIRND